MRYEYAYFGTVNAYQVCESAAVCVYILLLRAVAAAAAAAAAVRHCTPATRGVFHTAAVVTINLYC